MTSSKKTITYQITRSVIAILTIAIIYLYMNNAFININGLSESLSFLILLVISAAALIFYPNKTMLKPILAMIVSLGLYACISYLDNMIHIFTMPTIIALIWIVISSFYIKKEYRGKDQKKKLISNIIKIFTLYMSAVLIVVSTIAAVPKSSFGISIFRKIFDIDNVQLITTSSNDTIENNIDTLALLRNEEWKKLSKEERLSVLSTVADIESNRFGLPYKVNVVSDDLGESTLGSFSENLYVIKIDTDHLMNDPNCEVLETICHESMHAYQSRLCQLYDDTPSEYRDLYVFLNVKEYKKNIDHYINGSGKDFVDYYLQRSEIDARNYAYVAGMNYFDHISKYLGISGNEFSEYIAARDAEYQSGDQT